MSIQQDLSKLEITLTKLYKDEIKRQDLIDTGLMLRTIEAKAKIVNSEIEITLSATDYFKFVDGNFDVTENVQKSNGWDKVIDIMESIVAQLIEKELE